MVGLHSPNIALLILKLTVTKSAAPAPGQNKPSLPIVHDVQRKCLLACYIQKTYSVISSDSARI